jgi:hypothetical protein
MTTTTKVVNLKVCPAVWADLSFEVGGIVESSTANLLGQSVTAFDFTSFYANLGVATESFVPGSLPPVTAGSAAPASAAVRSPTATTGSSAVGSSAAVTIQPVQTIPEPAYLLNSADILSALGSAPLVALRAETTKAVLDKACALRANVYFAKYSAQAQAAIIPQLTQNYSVPSGSKYTYLTTLSSLASNQYSALNSAYASDPIRKSNGVVQSTSSKLTNADTITNTTTTNPSPNDAYSMSFNITGQAQQTFTINTENPAIAMPGAASGASVPNLIAQDGTQSSTLHLPAGYNSSTTVTTYKPDPVLQSQTISYTDYGFRIPGIEAQAQNARAQISLMDEQFSLLMAAQSLPNLQSDVFPNELKAMDMDVKRLQVAYLNTMLLSPISGVVTGVYKNAGDRVFAGETVVRVENNSTFYLVGVIIYRAMLAPGTAVSVQTTLFSSSTTTTIPGTIVTARGDPSGDDRWEVVISCNNISAGNPILPLNYHFDFDDTTVTIA